MRNFASLLVGPLVKTQILTFQPRAEKRGEQKRVGHGDREQKPGPLPVRGDAGTPTRLVGRALALLTEHPQAVEPALGPREVCTWNTQLGGLWGLLQVSGDPRKSVHTVAAGLSIRPAGQGVLCPCLVGRGAVAYSKA